ncbi:hypothetical protein DMH01_03320 [Amycolatopsis sp. WAC 04182]|uniref:DUF6093 family protein n=1 Tax=Amycolatopsis sp. WAC 04182 TaxID=2203198 RepID=UPI000F7A0676|nr:DUF6093 family protein [Amycolatopsis sp. WAC 04182]RSN65421.1 hypothetical protein DMH01_03320 [Amycolatopsis sp. WAC 04182]
MSALAAVMRGRRRAEALMLDTCRIRAVTGTTTDPDGVVTPTYGPVVYTGKCKIQNWRSFPSNPDAGEHQWTVTPTFLHLPVATSGAVATGMFVEILTAVDPLNVGRQFRLRSSDRKSLMTAVRFQVEEVSA